MLPSWVSHCRIGDTAIFLDVRRNRYTALRWSLARHLVEPTCAPPYPPAVQAAMDALGWQTASDRSPQHRPDDPCPMPAAEITLDGPATITSPLLLAETVMMLGLTKLQLSRIPLERVLENAAARNRRAGVNGNPEPAQANCLTDLIVALQTAERFFLRRDTCLLRSLALHAMLARRRLPAALVFGVKLHPFEAHCWVQRGQTLVNDTVERVGLFVPIRAVA